MWALIPLLFAAASLQGEPTMASQGALEPQGPFRSGADEALDHELASPWTPLGTPAGSPLELHTRAFLEAVSPSGQLADNTAPSHAQEFRSARIQAWLDLSGFQARAQWEFSAGEVDFKELYGQTELHGVRLRAGHLREPAGIDGLRGLSYTPFPERSSASQAFTPGRNLGVMAHTRSGPWSTWLGVFRASEEASLQPEGEGRSVTARGVWTQGGDGPDESLLHVGLWVSQRRDGLRFRSRPGTARLPRLIDTGDLGTADAITQGVELAWQRRGWTLSAEWMGAEVDQGEGSDAFLSGAHAEATWRPGGEARGYAKGKGSFRGFLPANPKGAIELALRVGRSELDGGGIAGGTQNDLGIGFNIQLTERSRWMLHFQRSKAGAAELRAVLVRLQIGF